MESLKYIFSALLIFYFGLCSTEDIDICSQNVEVIGELESCPEGEYLVTSECIPKCIKKLGKGEKCIIKSDNCAPGLKCTKDHDPPKICVADLDSNSCFRHKYIDVPEGKLKNIWYPECLPDGKYAPIQCKGGLTGKCYCYSSDGKRIFGEAFTKEAKDMTCACSRHRSELEKAGRTDVTLHCDSLGNYEPLQCDSDLCWCAEPKTGAVISSVVPPSMMEYLPCYKKDDIGEQYLRQCESQLYARGKIVEKLKKHGTEQISFQFVLCDWDGSYGRFKLESNNIVACTERNGEQSGAWQTEVTPSTPIDSFDCNCARDTVLYKKLGISFLQKCEGNGSYQRVQISDGVNFCVDKDGFRTTNTTKDKIDPSACPPSL